MTTHDKMIHPRPSLLTAEDLYLFNEGTHYRLWEKLGAHPTSIDGEKGTQFAVWAPNAKKVTVIGDFNGWNKTKTPLHCKGDSGIWEGFVPGIGHGALYKYFITSHQENHKAEKCDPLAFFHEAPPRTACAVWDLGYEWRDQEWMAARRSRNALDAPLSIYEVHLGSWARVPEEDNRWMTYR